MKKRAFYFWLEQLKISPAERKAVSLLLLLFVSLTVINATLNQHVPYGEAYYEKLDKAFEQRAAIVRERENKILARYKPEIREQAVGSAVQDTIPADSLNTTRPDKNKPVNEKASEQININTATAEVLQSLPGIGEVYAHRIVKYREENGNFTDLQQLINIKGIGKKRLEKLKPFIKLRGSTEN